MTPSVPQDPTAIAGRSFDVTLAECQELPDLANCEGWVLHFRRLGDGLELVYSGANLAASPLERDGERWRLGEPLVLADTGGLFFRRLTAEMLTFEFMDTDGDGLSDRLQATGNGVFERGIDDGSPGRSQMLLALAGPVDRTAPTLPATEQANPLDTATLTPSEALSLESTAHIVDSSGVRIDAAAVQELGVVPRFEVATILPFATSWEWVASGADLMGNVLPGPVSLSILPGPALIPTDLEADVPFAEVESGCSCGGLGVPGPYASVGSIPAISGTMSFLVPADKTIVFRAQRPASATAIRLQLRTLTDSYGVAHQVSLRAGVIGGTLRTSAESTANALSDVIETGSSPYTRAGPVEDIVLQLPDEGDEVLLEVAGGCDCTRSAPWLLGAWVDSIAFE